MSKHLGSNRTRRGLASLDAKLAAYLASAGAASVAISSTADGAVVAHTTSQTIGINGDVNVDFNSDNQVDFQLDHDRFNLGGTNLDYLQVEKNDQVNLSNATAFPTTITPESLDQTPFDPHGTNPNNNSELVTFLNPDTSAGNLGGYIVALKSGDTIGPTLQADTRWDYQEGGDINFSGKAIRANRLIDEDATQIDQGPGGRAADKVYVPYKPDPPSATLDDWNGLNGATRYVGVRVDLNNAHAGTPIRNYGWIGVRIDNEADATGVVTGWAYESTPDMPIEAGFAGPGDFNRDGRFDGGDFLLWQQQFGSTVEAGKGADANGDTLVNALDYNIWKGAFGAATGAATSIPEPGSMLMAVLGGGLICGCWLMKRFRLRTSS